ncbi:MAG TPA: hypothetical protein VN642_05210 [Dongiaceae bacterium]|nr:hypothetical protein [Dongiaceae bacterium]
MNRQRLILFILVILFGIAALWSYSTMPRPKTVSTLTYKPGQAAKPASAPVNKTVPDEDDGTRLKISLLDNEPHGFKGYRRNIFKPIFGIDLNVVKKKAEAIKPPPIVQAPAPPVIVKPEPPPLARFTFLGFLKKGLVRTVFLAKDNDILLVKKGDKVAGRYEVTEISDQALKMTVTDTGGEIVIPLVETKPLTIVK